MNTLRRSGAIMLLVCSMLIAALLSACSGAKPTPTPAKPGTVTPPATEKPTTPPATSGLPLKVDGQSLVFGPFRGDARGMDYFWLADGKRTIVTVSNKEGTQQLWLIDVAGKSSRMLREAKGIDAIFPVGFAGVEKVVTMEIPREQSAKTGIYTIDFANNGVKVQLCGEFQGRALQHAITRDGKFVTVHFSNQQGGRLWRVDTTTNAVKDLVTGLPIWDGLYPVWFSPDGTQAAMPEVMGNGPDRRIKIVNLVTGEVRSTRFAQKSIDLVRWSDDGKHFAYKIADGSHKMIDVSDFSIAISPKVRVASATGEVVKELLVPQGRLVGDLAWVTNTSLVLRERKSATQTGSAWVARTDGTFEAAKPEHIAVLEQPIRPYPMAKGRSALYEATIKQLQAAGGAPAEEFIIKPIK